jgi:hypothetical protein
MLLSFPPRANLHVIYKAGCYLEASGAPYLTHEPISHIVEPRASIPLNVSAKHPEVGQLWDEINWECACPVSLHEDASSQKSRVGMACTDGKDADLCEIIL